MRARTVPSFPGTSRSAVAAAWLALVAIPVPATLAQPTDLRVQQLSPEGTPTTGIPNSSALRAISPDGKWIVHWADALNEGVPELYAAPRFGGAPVRLTAVRADGSDPEHPPLITPDSRRVIFVTDQETPNRLELWSVPIQGPLGAAIKLSPDDSPDAEVDNVYRLSADGTRVIFLRYDDGFAYWSVPVDGSSPAVQLTPPPNNFGVERIRYGEERIVFLGDFTTPTQSEVYSAPVDGSTPAVRISGAMQASGDAHWERLALSPDGQRVLYVADERFDGVYELFSTPVLGPPGAAVRLSPTLPAGRNVTSVEFSSDGARALFLICDGGGAPPCDLWSAPAAQAGASVRLNRALVAGGSIDVGFFDDGVSAFYQGDEQVDGRRELFQVPIAGPATASQAISGPIVVGGGVQVARRLDLPGGSAILVRGDLRLDGHYEYFAAPLAGIDQVEPLFTADPEQAGSSNGCAVETLGDDIVFCADPDADQKLNVYRAPIDQSAAPIRLSDGTVQLEADVTNFHVDPRGHWVVFRRDGAIANRFDLYRALATGSGVPQRIHATPAFDTADVETAFEFTPDGYGVVYAADHDVEGKLELWIADGMVFRADFEWGNLDEWSAHAP